jgi:hypothetical protein
MVQLLAYFVFAFKAVVQSRIAFHLGMKKLDRHHHSRADVGGPKNGSHTAAGNEIVNAVMIELAAGME